MRVDAAPFTVQCWFPIFLYCFIISQTHRRSNLEVLLEIIKVKVDPEFYRDVTQSPTVKGLA